LGPSNTNYNSYKITPRLILYKEKKKGRGEGGRRSINLNIFKGFSRRSIQFNGKEEKLFFFSELILEMEIYWMNGPED